MMTCDGSGNIVDYEIQEGKGDFQDYVSCLGRKWSTRMPTLPLLVCDREGHGNDYHGGLVDDRTPFVTWEKHVDVKKIEAIDESRFKNEFEVNGSIYSAIEGEKTIIVNKDSDKQKTVTLRLIYLWNKTRNRKVTVVASTALRRSEWVRQIAPPLLFSVDGRG
jgi:hypothetical protein